METYNRDQLYKKLITVYTEASPNPNSMKFVLNSMLSQDETFSRDYPEAAATTDSPLAKELFERFDSIRRVFMSKNFITLTKEDAADWHEIIPVIKQFLKQYLEAEKPVVEGEQDFEHAQNFAKEAVAADSEDVKKIKDILEEYIRPAVEGDGGLITFHSFDEQEGLLKVMLQGSCSGCPSSTITLKAGIENLFKRMMPDKVKQVVAENM